MKKFLIAVLIIVALAGVYTWSAYNKFIKTNEQVDGQWAQVETQYQRRFDLIPNLVNSVRGIMTQEQKIFGDLAEARTHYSGAVSVEERVNAVNEMESSLARLLVVMENYPQLKSAENVQTLMVQLEGTENRISVERGRYNDSVREFNIMAKKFPSSLIAGIFGFDERAYFESAQGAENTPNVSL
jgi:LemA protein